MQLSSEILAYPLLLVATRLSVLELPLGSDDIVYLPGALSLSSLFNFFIRLCCSPAAAGAAELFILTLHADGWLALWRGVIPFCISSSVDDIATALFFFISKKQSSSSTSSKRSSSSSSSSSNRSNSSSNTHPDTLAAAAAVEEAALLEAPVTAAATAAADASALAAAATQQQQQQQQQQQDKGDDAAVGKRLQQLEECTMRAWLSGEGLGFRV